MILMGPFNMRYSMVSCDSKSKWEAIFERLHAGDCTSEQYYYKICICLYSKSRKIVISTHFSKPRE